MIEVRNERGRLSDTLALRELLVQATDETQAVDQVLLVMQGFRDSYRTGPYWLDDAQPSKVLLVPTILQEIFGREGAPPPNCDFADIESLARDFEAQAATYRVVSRLPLSRSLMNFLPNQAGDQEYVIDRKIHLMTRQALGGQRLEAALDDLLGADFGRLVLENIVTAWRACLWAIHRDRDFTRAAKFMGLALVMRHALPLGSKPDARDPRWTCLVNKPVGSVINLTAP